MTLMEQAGLGPGRMRCERLSCTMSVSTCLARQKNIRATGGVVGEWSTGVRILDPGCLECDQGKQILASNTPSREDTSLYKGDHAVEDDKKLCKTCNQEKDRGDFYAAKQNNDGLEGSCKICRLKKQKNADMSRRHRKPPEIVNYQLPGERVLLPETITAPKFTEPSPASTPAPVCDSKSAKIVITIDCSGIIDALRKLIMP